MKGIVAKSPLMVLGAFSLGIITSTYWGFWALGLMFTGILGCCLLSFTLTGKTRGSYLLFSLLFISSFIGIGLNLHSKEMQDFPIRKLANEQVTLIGVVVEEPKLVKGKYRGIISINKLWLEQSTVMKEYIGQKVLLTIPAKGNLDLAYGQVLKVHGQIQLPLPASNPGAFDYRLYLKRQGIGAVINLWNDSGVKIVGDQPPNAVMALALSIKNQGEVILKNTLAETYYPLVEGFIFGDTGELDEEVNDSFAKLGIIHILSVSGYHMVLIMGLSIYCFQLISCPRWLRFWGILFVLAMYATMAGWSPPVARAFLMGTGALVATIYQDRLNGKLNGTNIIAFTALVLLIYKPQYLFEIGFQLSFLATWGIIYLTMPISVLLGRLKVPLPLQALLAGTLGAQIATLPIIAYYFNFISLMAILANLATIFLVEIIMVLGILSLFLGAITIKLAMSINFSTNYFCWLLLKITFLLSKIPYGAIYVTKPNVPQIGFYYLSLLLALGIFHNYSLVKVYLYRGRSYFLKFENRFPAWQYPKIMSFGLGLCLLGIFLISQGFINPKDNLRVTYLDVGQGDSTLITTPEGKNILIDSGGFPAKPDYSLGEKVVAPSLFALGVSELDLLIITHDHFDHYGGVMGLLDKVKVKQVVLPYKTGEAGFNETIQKLRNLNVPMALAFRGQTFKVEDEVVIKVLNPPRSLYTGTESDSNNNSVVLKLTYGLTIFYFTGDIQGEVIREWPQIDAGLRDKKQKIIWKVPHHGSKFSNAANFYENLHPNWSIISVGKNNFGHPNTEILRDLNTFGSRLFRTDQLGAVTVESDGTIVKGSWFKKGDY